MHRQQEAALYADILCMCFTRSWLAGRWGILLWIDGSGGISASAPAGGVAQVLLRAHSTHRLADLDAQVVHGLHRAASRAESHPLSVAPRALLPFSRLLLLLMVLLLQLELARVAVVHEQQEAARATAQVHNQRPLGVAKHGCRRCRYRD